jgi:hypothetical protein
MSALRFPTPSLDSLASAMGVTSPSQTSRDDLNPSACVFNSQLLDRAGARQMTRGSSWFLRQKPVCGLIRIRDKSGKKRPVDLVFLLTRLTAGSTIPTGILLVIAAFDKTKLAAMQDVYYSCLFFGCWCCRLILLTMCFAVFRLSEVRFQLVLRCGKVDFVTAELVQDRE